jgi:hypothetical protein
VFLGLPRLSLDQGCYLTVTGSFTAAKMVRQCAAFISSGELASQGVFFTLASSSSSAAIAGRVQLKPQWWRSPRSGRQHVTQGESASLGWMVSFEIRMRFEGRAAGDRKRSRKSERSRLICCRPLRGLGGGFGGSRKQKCKMIAFPSKAQTLLPGTPPSGPASPNRSDSKTSDRAYIPR